MSAVYHVQTPNGDRLIKASSKSVAVNHVVKNTITAKSVTASEMADLIDKGLKIEDAGKETSNTGEAGEKE